MKKILIKILIYGIILSIAFMIVDYYNPENDSCLLIGWMTGILAASIDFE